MKCRYSEDMTSLLLAFPSSITRLKGFVCAEVFSNFTILKAFYNTATLKIVSVHSVL